MIKQWIRNLHFWIGSRDFFAAHIHLAKSLEETTIITEDDSGLTISVYSSSPDMVKKLSDLVATFEHKEAMNGQ